jgi:hypothetical protein
MQQVNERDGKRHLNRDYREREEITKAPWHLRDETPEIGFMTVEREKWPNARVGPADGGGLLGQQSQYNDYHGSFCIPIIECRNMAKSLLVLRLLRRRG